MLILVAAGAAVSNIVLTPAIDVVSKAWAGWDAGKASRKRPTAATNEGAGAPAFHLLPLTRLTALAGPTTAFISTPPATCIASGLSTRRPPRRSYASGATRPRV